MKARLVRIGRSRGVRLPKPLIERAGLVDDVELDVRDGVITIAAARPARAGWAEAAARLATEAPGGLLDVPTPTCFEEDEWSW